MSTQKIAPTTQDTAPLPPSPTRETDDISKASDPENDPQSGGLKSYVRIFSYADSFGWTLNALALVGTIGAGSVLPLMDLLFGKMLTTFNDLATGQSSPEEFRDDLDGFVYGALLSIPASTPVGLIYVTPLGYTLCICLLESLRWFISGQ
jgi:ATP-binding cassette subfamily B (MDR/TAP) protein 1